MEHKIRPETIGKAMCSCGGTYYTCEQRSEVQPVNGDPKFHYDMEFSMCDSCSNEIILPRQVKLNDLRVKQARLESTVAYRMKKWLNHQDHPSSDS